MNDSKSIRQKLIDYLMGMDLTDMNMKDLREYTEIVSRVVDMERPGYAECLSMMTNGCFAEKKEV